MVLISNGILNKFMLCTISRKFVKYFKLSWHLVYLLAMGRLYVFGEGDGGKLGLGDDDSTQFTPRHIESIRDKVVSASCGHNHTVVLTGMTYCILSILETVNAFYHFITCFQMVC